jgi:hypothetical protein
MSEQIKNFMKTYLHNVECYVRSEGIYIDKGTEQSCHLIFEDNWGLGIYSSLEYNSIDIGKNVEALTQGKNLFPYGEVLEYMRGKFIKQLKQTEIQLGRIYPFSIIKINTNFEKGVLRDCIFIFEKGSICEFINIKPFINNH